MTDLAPINEKLSELFTDQYLGIALDHALRDTELNALSLNGSEKDITDIVLPKNGRAMILEGDHQGAVLQFENIRDVLGDETSRVLILDEAQCKALKRNVDVKTHLDLLVRRVFQPAFKLDHQARKLERATRDESLEAYVKLRLIDMMNVPKSGKPQSIIDLLSPGRKSYNTDLGGGNMPSVTWEERAWKLTHHPSVLIGWMLLGEDRLRGIAEETQAELKSPSLMEDVRVRSQLHIAQRSAQKFIYRIEDEIDSVLLKENLGMLVFDHHLFDRVDEKHDIHLRKDLTVVRRRVAQLMWLTASHDKSRNYELPSTTAESINRRLSDPDGPNFRSIFRYLDDQIEPYFRKNTEVRRITGMSTVRGAPTFNLVTSEYTELPKTHRAFSILKKLDRELENGALSVVGGSDYAVQRLMASTLFRYAKGALKIVINDGIHDEGIDWVLENANSFSKKGKNRNTPYSIEGEMDRHDLNPLYGNFPTSLITLRGGRQFLVISSIGEGRQISFAAAALIYKTEPGNKRGSINDLVLIRGPKSSKERIHEDLSRIFQEENMWIEQNGVFSQSVKDASEIPTRALTMMHGAAGIDEVLRDDKTIGFSHSTNSIGDIHFRYIEHDGKLQRFIVSGIGSHGVYEQTAGELIEVCDELPECNLVPDVYGISTAGGSIGGAELPPGMRGLPEDTEPGKSFAMPMNEIIDIYGGGSHRIKRINDSLIRTSVRDQIDAHISKLSSEGKLYVTDNHGNLVGPATGLNRTVIDSQEKHGVSTVDVEGKSIARAVLNADGSYNIIYLISDDVVAGASENRYATYACMYYFVQGAPPDRDICKLVRLLIQDSIEQYYLRGDK